MAIVRGYMQQKCWFYDQNPIFSGQGLGADPVWWQGLFENRIPYSILWHFMVHHHFRKLKLQYKFFTMCLTVFSDTSKNELQAILAESHAFFEEVEKNGAFFHFSSKGSRFSQGFSYGRWDPFNSAGFLRRGLWKTAVSRPSTGTCWRLELRFRSFPSWIRRGMKHDGVPKVGLATMGTRSCLF